MIATTNTLPENITATECTEVTIAQLTETPAGGTRWIIGTIADHADEGMIDDTLEIAQRGRFGFIEDDADWEERVVEVLAKRGWVAVYGDDIALDTNILLARA
ncbi:hypothetical protein ACFWPK_04180 [Nocardia sp. NPDC058519]|uniref:hypothetical protein n=1 Tax=Nocardia sp. NPDC058519 TaxID=3346535 RepID=UPI0036664CC8